MSGFATVLKSDGRVVVECPYLKDLIDHTEFDTIYHEHLCYFSLTALVHLFKRHGLDIVDVERLPIHGGSIRIFAAHAGAATVGQSVRDLLAQEQNWVRSSSAHSAFANRVETFEVFTAPQTP